MSDRGNSGFLQVEDDDVPSALVQRLRSAAKLSGVLPDDPLAVIVEAMAHTIEDLGRRQAAFDDAATATVNSLAGLLRAGRDAVRAEAVLVRTQAGAAKIGLVSQVAEASAKAAAAALSRRARVVDRRSTALVGLCLAGALGIGSLGGWWAGYRNARAAVIQNETNLRAAFRDGADAARLWLDLMQWNDPRAALLTCRGADEIFIHNGRRACRVPLWVEKPPQVGP